MHSQSIIISVLFIAFSTLSRVSADQVGGEKVLIKKAFGGHHAKGVGHHLSGQVHHTLVVQVSLVLFSFHRSEKVFSKIYG